MAFKIYTKTGDKGSTSLYGGARLSKDDIRIEAYGTVDELNACIGLVSDGMNALNLIHCLEDVQNRLFTVGSNLASDPSKEMITPDLLISDVTLLENEIDQYEMKLQPLKHFVLPGGHQLVSFCHIARTVCRRAERRVVTLSRHSHVEEIIIVYLNRLSDFLFVLGRYIAYTQDVDERKWIPRAAKS